MELSKELSTNKTNNPGNPTATVHFADGKPELKIYADNLYLLIDAAAACWAGQLQSSGGLSTVFTSASSFPTALGGSKQIAPGESFEVTFDVGFVAVERGGVVTLYNPLVPRLPAKRVKRCDPPTKPAPGTNSDTLTPGESPEMVLVFDVALADEGLEFDLDF
jgi:hypothetical protein